MSRPNMLEGNPSPPWGWTGGYPQTVMAADATLVAHCYEDPDRPARIAPLICEAVNALLAQQEPPPA